VVYYLKISQEPTHINWQISVLLREMYRCDKHTQVARILAVARNYIHYTDRASCRLHAAQLCIQMMPNLYQFQPVKLLDWYPSQTALSYRQSMQLTLGPSSFTLRGYERKIVMSFYHLPVCSIKAVLCLHALMAWSIGTEPLYPH